MLYEKVYYQNILFKTKYVDIYRNYVHLQLKSTIKLCKFTYLAFNIRKEYVRHSLLQ